MDYDKVGQAAGFGKGMLSNASVRINELANEYAKQANVSFAKAVDHVTSNTAEGRALYAETTR